MVHPTIQIPFNNGIRRNNVVAKARQSKSDICTYVEPRIQETHLCQND